MWREASRTWEALAIPELLKDAREVDAWDTVIEPRAGKPRDRSRLDPKRGGSRIGKVTEVGETTADGR